MVFSDIKFVTGTVRAMDLMGHFRSLCMVIKLVTGSIILEYSKGFKCPPMVIKYLVGSLDMVALKYSIHFQSIINVSQDKIKNVSMS